MKYVLWPLLILLASSFAWAQTGSLRGQVADQNGAVVPGAKITVSGPSGLIKITNTDKSGSYSISGLPAGDYEVRASAPNLELAEPAKISLKGGAQTLHLQLKVVLAPEKVTVDENAAPTVSTDPNANASAQVLRGSDLDALSDNPADLAADLLALAGPAAGPSGGQIFIDGFSGGDLPPKNAIREIRINQNPFSAEYDKLGFGRIEIFTKPGTDKFQGSVGYNFATSKWNSRNAYAAEKAPFHLEQFNGTVSGSINKRASYNLSFEREWNKNGNVINGVILDPITLIATPFTGSALSYEHPAFITPRLDYQLNDNNTLTVRYSFNRTDVRNAGVGGLNLVSRGYHNLVSSQTVQVTETAVLSPSVINETRFQYYRPTVLSQANTTGFALQVLGAFNDGGAQLGRTTDTQNSYELQNYTTILRGVHTWRFGARLRAVTDVNVSPQNFGGTFTFSGGAAPQLDANNVPVLDASGQPVLVNISSIESYRRTLLFQQNGLPASQIRQLGGGASQFSIRAGNPLISGSQYDLGAFVGDDWKVRPNLTLSLGLRYETQNNIHDWGDLSPRITVAWAPGPTKGNAPLKTVLRAGVGVFYDRFSLSNTLAALRYNGIVQQQYVITNPDFFPAIPSIPALAAFQTTQSIQQISPTLRAPYVIQSAVSLERQLPFKTTIAVTYLNSHGLHLLRSQNINAPLPGTYMPTVPGSGVFPLGRPGPVILMESAGLYNQNQLIVNVNSKVNRGISLNASYGYNHAMSNTDGLGTFPAMPYSMDGEYGPAATDIQHRFSLSGTVTVKWGIRFNPLLATNSGPPFDITVGHDLYGDSLFNGRPGIATAPNKPGVVVTRYGLLDPNPTPGETLLPRNFGRGPGQIMLNMRVGRTFAFGGDRKRGAASAAGGGGGGGGGRGAPASPFSTGGGGQGGAGGSPDHRYSLTVSMQIRNVTNHNNPGPIFGNITSPLFGRANQPAGSGGVFSESANNRRLELQTRFTF